MLRKIKVRRTELKIRNRKMASFFLTKKKERISLAAVQKVNGKKQILKAETHGAAFSNPGKTGGDLRPGGSGERAGIGIYIEKKGAGLADGQSAMRGKEGNK